MAAPREAVIVDTCRTAFGKRGGALANWHPVDLLAHAITHLVNHSQVDPERVDDVIGGCVTQVGEQSTNVARNAWVAAGLPQSVPATTVDRQCGSSQQAVHFAAAGRGGRSLRPRHRLRGGVDEPGAARLQRPGRDGAVPQVVPRQSSTAGCGCSSGWPRSWPTSGRSRRQDMDEYALESHRRAAAATDSGHFAKEAIPVPIRDDEGTLTGEVLGTDEGIRRDTTLERLAALPPAQSFEPDTAPDITAGNSSQMTDGAAAMLIAERSVAERLGLPVLARFHAFAVAAEDAAIVLSAPVPVTRKLLERTGMSIDDFDAIECNEAFAAIALMWARAFSPDPDRLNPRGGAIAIGHPLGASGVRLMTTLLNQLRATGGRYGFQTMCEGGGQANATVIERLA